MQAAKLTVFGIVQGVGFRYMTKQVADELGVVGFVKNRVDGSVYIEAQAEPLTLYKFISQIKAGPSPAGHVDHISVTEMKPKDYQDFRVEFY